ncbi:MULTISPECIES: hypothetical protein [Burkholderia]|uniref:Uncharacterized protein n=1 Tax=Burkholderia savannae TaxID=1637837 RepID=A0ABR5TEV8_9BURK|nr:MULTISPECIES: hypothetical protein [Burkholderia]KGS05970.1 hypothetical protein X946_2320 [Burkholderia sp. ABCPW 111]KWZ43532.1 hypothetical protein WS72_12150 [Burkholderia savannae]KWZ46554.1 hypothetical protein WS73_21285 [Burkholderia savannae]
MNDPRSKKNPVFGVAILIVVVIGLVIGTVLYNAISQKREYDEAHPQTSSAPSAASAHG